MPGAIVYTRDEEAEPLVMGGPTTSARLLIANIEIHTDAGSAQFDDTIDDLAALVEIALSRDGTRFDMCQDYDYIGFTAEFNKDAKRASGVGVLEYRFKYHVKENNPEAGV
jgi:hypothetical protein